MKTRLIVFVTVGVMLAAVPLFAHHSFMAEYGGAAVNLKGKLIKFDWVNPHSWAYVEVTGADGLKHAGFSDDHGFYTIAAPAGRVAVTASKPGFRTRRSEFVLVTDTVLNFSLTAE